MPKFLIVFFFVFASLHNHQLNAQKYGHLNMGLLLEQMDEVKEGDEELDRFRNSLYADRDQLVKRFEAEVKKYQIDVEAGLLSQVQMQEREKTLQALREAAVAAEQGIVNKVAKKRKEIIEPILIRVEKAIQEVGKEKGFTAIFDEGLLDGVLYSEPENDVMKAVKAKLGM